MADNEKTKLLLLIEDDDDHAELAEFYINEHDPSIRVKRLQDGEAAINYSQAIIDDCAEVPWLVFLDLKLPKYDGHDVLFKLKSNKQLLYIPVVIFSTSNSNSDILRAMDNHANSYIVKPMEPDAYAQLVSQVIDYWLLNQHHLINH